MDANPQTRGDTYRYDYANRYLRALRRPAACPRLSPGLRDSNARAHQHPRAANSYAHPHAANSYAHPHAANSYAHLHAANTHLYPSAADSDLHTASAYTDGHGHRHGYALHRVLHPHTRSVRNTRPISHSRSFGHPRADAHPYS